MWLLYPIGSSHRIHGNGIFTYMNGWFLRISVGKYATHGSYGYVILFAIPFLEIRNAVFQFSPYLDFQWWQLDNHVFLAQVRCSSSAIEASEFWYRRTDRQHSPDWCIVRYIMGVSQNARPVGFIGKHNPFNVVLVEVPTYQNFWDISMYLLLPCQIFFPNRCGASLIQALFTGNERGSISLDHLKAPIPGWQCGWIQRPISARKLVRIICGLRVAPCT